MCSWLHTNQSSSGIAPKAKDTTHNYQQAFPTNRYCMLFNHLKVNRVEPYFIFFPLLFCFTFQMLKFLDTGFCNVDLTWHQYYLHLRLITYQWTNTVALQLSMHRTSKHAHLLNDIMLTGSLSQHTASTCTFEDMKHLISILLLFCQQVVIGKQR